MSDSAQTPRVSRASQLLKSTLFMQMQGTATGVNSVTLPAKSPSVTPTPVVEIVSEQITEEPASTNSFAQAVPLAVQEFADTINPLNPASPTTGSVTKESREPGFTLEKPVIEQVSGIQQVEQEPQVEFSPEVEAYLTKVENHHDQLPQEIVIADSATVAPPTKYLAQPVIILPITPEIEREGLHKPVTFSVRWLVEWSRKLMKAFNGKIIYRAV